MRLPVAEKIALHSAGSTGGTPGSPTPPSVAALTPITHAPSICAGTRSGLIVAPQSTAMSTRGIVSSPFASTATWTTAAAQVTKL